MAEAISFLIGANDEHGLNPPTAGKRTPRLPYINRSFYENEFNSQAKLMFILACLRCNFNIFNVHPEVQDVSISTRVRRINSAGLSLLVTFAYNAAGDANSFSSANGVEVYYSPFSPRASESRRLSELIFNQIVANTNRRGRFVATLSVGVLSSVNCVSSLIEAGFMTNFNEAKQMLNPNFTLAVGEATCEAVCKFLNVPYLAREIQNYPTLRQTSRGNQVEMLQYLLREYGFDVSTDGIFGGKTYAAVISFQKNNNLTADGIVGRNTWSALLNLNPTSFVLRQGSRQSAVLYLQRLLLSYLYPITDLDGIFGGETLRAVQAFQTENGLTPDGIVGANTWRVLLNSAGRPQN